MSLIARNWAWQAEIPTAPKFVLVALADESREENPGRHYWTVIDPKHLHWMTGISVRGINRHLAWLEENGWITISQPDGRPTTPLATLHTSLPASGRRS